jgi:hypothetical protein
MIDSSRRHRGLRDAIIGLSGALIGAAIGAGATWKAASVASESVAQQILASREGQAAQDKRRKHTISIILLADIANLGESLKDIKQLADSDNKNTIVYNSEKLMIKNSLARWTPHDLRGLSDTALRNFAMLRLNIETCNSAMEYLTKATSPGEGIFIAQAILGISRVSTAAIQELNDLQRELEETIHAAG